MDAPKQVSVEALLPEEAKKPLDKDKVELIARGLFRPDAGMVQRLAIAHMKAAHWIPVGDDMPDDQAPILYVVRTVGVEPYVRKGVRGWDGNYWFWCDEDGEMGEEGNDGEESHVSHWMPLPEVP